MILSTSPAPGVLPEALFVGAEPVADAYSRALGQRFRVRTAFSTNAVMERINVAPPAVVVADLDAPRVEGVLVCRLIAAMGLPPPVLVTTAEAERVPDALIAGCSAVLLKPFAPNLLCARVGRLLCAWSVELRLRAQRATTRAAHLREACALPAAGTNRVWPDTACPHCTARGAVAFEFSSYRRAWYACLECRKVWLGRRQEP